VSVTPFSRGRRIAGCIPGETIATAPPALAVSDFAVSISSSVAVAVRAHDPSQRAALAPSAPSDARTQGDRNSSAIRSTEDAAARSVRGGDSAVRGRGEWAPFPPAMTAPGTGLLPPHNSTASNFNHPAPVALPGPRSRPREDRFMKAAFASTSSAAAALAALAVGYPIGRLA
jgi:hypothetical protein